MSSEEVDPIIAALADPELISRKAAVLFRRHRPVAECFYPPGHSDNADRVLDYYTVGHAVWDSLEKRSISPVHSPVLFKEAVRLTRIKVPDHEAIESRRLEKARRIQAAIHESVDLQG